MSAAFKDEIKHLEKQLENTRNAAERGKLADLIRIKKQEARNSNKKTFNKEIVPDKESPARIEHKERKRSLSRGDVVMYDSNFAIKM